VLILNVIQGPDKGRRFDLPDHEPQQIGRSSESLPLADTTISRRHAELTPDQGKWVLRDLDSANGTYVNGKRIHGPTRLRSGDQIRTGATIFVFGRASAPTTMKPVRVLPAARIDTAIDATMSSNDDSVVMDVPDPAVHLKILYELMQLVGSIFDKQVLLERVMDLVTEHFGPDRGFVLLRDAEGKPQPVVVRFRQKPSNKEEKKISVSKTIVKHVIDKSEGVLSTNAMTDKRFSAGDSVQSYGIRSAICVPVKFREKVYGVIYIDSRVANYTFTEDQLRLMTAIGAQTGLAIENAELYQQGLARARLAAVGETVASLAHSIRNMLQAIRGGGEVIELGLRKSDIAVVKNGWEVLSRNLDRLLALTMNMLAFSKSRKPEIEMSNLGTLLAEIIALFQPLCDRRNVALITEVEADLPPIPLDESGIHQAVMNLLNNALDAADPGSGVITLGAHYDPHQNTAKIVISDNGEGISPENFPHLFTPFYSTKGLRGTGLGLVVTRRIIEEHDGRVDVVSEPNKGATFTITLPADSKGDPSATNF
jgi:two-component system NtrC family sensor kinase